MVVLIYLKSKLPSFKMYSNTSANCGSSFRLTKHGELDSNFVNDIPDL